MVNAADDRLSHPPAPEGGYWYSRWLFERALALLYAVAFLVALNQFVPLLGEHGLLPVPRFVRQVPFRITPSLFYLAPTDTAFRAAAWLGLALSVVALLGLASRARSLAAAGVWALLWLLYLSFVNVGQTFYAFGWETLLLETGFLAIFLGGRTTRDAIVCPWLLRWVLFRVMFGAGLIKWRGDPCWRDLTCLDFYFETQPIPNPLTWYFHRLPDSVHHAGVVLNHVVELGLPLLLFAPQPVAGIAGLVTIAFQFVLIASGNLSWLNWLTIALAIATLPDRWLRWLPVARPALDRPTVAGRGVGYALLAVVAVLSIAPVVNMLSAAQVMNTSYDPLHLVNTYGAFGSITQVRHEIVVEGTDAALLTDATTWRAYEFKGKPGDPFRMPAQIAPYHLRLDWLMWFAAMSEPVEHEWFAPLLEKLLRGDPATLGLLGTNPFPGRPPRYVRAEYYTYRLTAPAERRATGRWWHRERLGVYYPAVSLR
jgi:Lipase maturation factor